MTEDELKRGGGGSGGGDDGDNTVQQADGVYEITANQILMITQDPDKDSPYLDPETPHANDHVITILAAGKLPAFADGKVDIRGSKGVRITTGPAITVPPVPATSDSTDGVEIVASETQNITIQRGLLPTDQKIEMCPGVINIDSGVGPGIISIKSFTSIELSVCDGVSKISLTPAGIILQGPIIMIN
jgi:hypothetical protein